MSEKTGGGSSLGPAIDRMGSPVIDPTETSKLCLKLRVNVRTTCVQKTKRYPIPSTFT
jgi:hypothetical protein